MQFPHRGHALTRNTAILGRVYYCAERKKAKLYPYFFNGIDKDVINQSPDYVKMRWRMDGFDFSHNSGISLSLLRMLRASVVQGLSVTGFRQSLLQLKREHHLMVSIQYRAYVDQLRSNRSLTGPSIVELNELQKRDFVDVDSDEYDEKDPSPAWLVDRVMKYMESDAEQKQHRMQLVDGEHLSGDHSFKLTKCISSGGQSHSLQHIA
jgi:hypothetical protein